jgi:hypothetical protein
MSGPMRTLSKGNKPWSSGSDNRGLLFEFWPGVMATVQMETDIYFWRVLSTDRDRRAGTRTTITQSVFIEQLILLLKQATVAPHGSAI